MANAREYAQQVFERMIKEADEHGRWKGHLTDLVTSVCSITYYSTIRTMLKKSGAAAQEQRGGGGSPSIWQILDGTIDLRTTVIEEPPAKVGPDLETRISKLEALVSDIDVKKAIFALATDIRLLKERQ